MNYEKISIINIILLYVLTQLLAIVLLPLFPTSYKAFPGQQNNPWIILYFLGYLVGITAIILYLIKKQQVRIIKYLFYFVMGIAIMYISTPVLYYLSVPYPGLISIFIAIFAIILLIKKPVWYVLDTIGVVAGAGIAVIMGMSLGIIPTILLLIIFAIYDSIAVYRTKHMVSLAEMVITNRLPALFSMPKSPHYHDNEQHNVKLNTDTTHRDVLYMGYGDSIIPTILTVSSIEFLNNYTVALSAFLGSVIGLVLLLFITAKGKPQAGLPLLNTGALVGFFLSYILIFIL